MDGNPSRNEIGHPPLPIQSTYWTQAADRQGIVNGMFDWSARHYDRVSNILSFGSGRTYRHAALERAGLHAGMTVLDVGTGTGLLAREAAAVVGSSGRVTGIDPSFQMMTAGRNRETVRFVQGLGERLPFANSRFDFVTMGTPCVTSVTWICSSQNTHACCKPNGRVLLLEITKPASAVGSALARTYFGTIVPRVTRLITGSADASRLMRFYWDTIAQCVAPPVILAALTRAGFHSERTVIAGIFSEYSGTRLK